jgi:cytoskeletal protein RodZ
LHIDFTSFLRHHAGIPAGLRSSKLVFSVRNKTMKRNMNKLALALLLASTFVAFTFVLSSAELIAQSAQSSGSDKPQSAAATSSSPTAAKPTSAASPSTTSAPTTPAKPQPPAANGAGVVWINTDTGVYHKQGTRWYGKTKHGKYMLETDAIKAGYKPAK